MKYQELKNIFKNEAEKFFYSVRIRKSSKVIRDAFKEWVATKTEPVLSINIKPTGNDGIKLKISLFDLTHLYGMAVPDALLLLDDLISASNKQDKSELNYLLESLKQHSLPSNYTVTEELKEKIRTQSPGVWKEYSRLLSKDDESNNNKAFDAIKNEEL